MHRSFFGCCFSFSKRRTFKTRRALWKFSYLIARWCLYVTFDDYNNVVYHKDRSLDLSYNQPTTARFTALVRLLSLPVCRQTFLSQWTAYQTAWMRSNRLQLKAEKNEVMWCASARPVSRITYTVLVETLNHASSIYLLLCSIYSINSFSMLTRL